MRITGVPRVFRFKWPLKTTVNPILNNELSWSPWGVFNTENIHCYTDDYRFEVTWRNPELALQRVLGLNLVIAPDFTVYPTADPIVNRWQLYRSLAVFSYWQSMGVNVIPSLNWVSPDQIRADADLYPRFSTVAVRCPGTKYYNKWVDGITELKKIVQPETVLHFGTKLGLDVWSDEVIYHFKLRSNACCCTECA